MSRRLLLSYLSITLFVLLVLEIPLGIQFARSERRNLETDIQHDAFALALRSEEVLEKGGPDAPGRLQDLSEEYQRTTGGRVVFVGSDGVLLADSDPPDLPGPPTTAPRDFSSRPEIAAALRGRESTGSRSSATLGTDLMYVAVPVASGDEVRGAVRITYPLSFVDDRVRRNWVLLIGVGAIVLVVVFLGSLLLSWSLTRPLAELQAGAARLGRGELDARVPVPHAPAEYAELARSFNTTAAQLQQLVDSQQVFVADASHQLRTPLAALRLRLENLEPDVVPAGREDLQGALEEVERLSRLVDGLLLLARAERQESGSEPVALGAVIESRCDAWSALAEERGVRLEREGDPPAVWSTPGRLEQVLDNLLNNALEVAPGGSTVRIATRRTDGAVELSVADAGPGMTEVERSRAFDRFWRADPGADGGGFGLGLAIVHRLVTSDGGGIELAESPAGGLEVRVRLRPAQGPPAAVRG